MKRKVFNILKYIVLILFTLMSLYLIYSVNKLNILKTLYFIGVCAIILLIWLLITINLLKNNSKIVSKVILCILSIILSCGYFMAVRYTNQAIKFVEDMTKINYETQNYSVLVLYDNYNSIEELNSKKIGFISTNINLDETKDKLKKEISYKSKEYEDVGSLIAGIYNNEIDALVIDESYIDLLEEYEVAFINESKSIYSFDIKVKKKDTRKKVNINEEPFILYISGTDSRTTVSDTARSDVNIVTVINPKTNKILLVSIPRDYYVQLHDTIGVKDKLTHAGVYGVEKSITTIEDLLSIDINYYGKVSFNTVVNIVDTIDGIDIYSDLQFNAVALDKSVCTYVEGINHLNGQCALRFARERKSYLTGDRHRGQNQQAVITAIIDKLKNPKYLVKYNDILGAANGTFETDLTYEEITSFVKYQLSELRNWQVESISLDGTGAMEPTYSMGSQRLYVMIPDQSTIDYAKVKINEYLEK